MLGQAIVAAGRHAADRRVVSANMIFLRAADARQPLRLELAELSSGRTFSGLAVQVFQDATSVRRGHAAARRAVRRRHPARVRPSGRRRTLRVRTVRYGRDRSRHQSGRRRLHERSRRAGGATRHRRLGALPRSARRSAPPRRPAGAVHRPHVDRRRPPPPRRGQPGPGAPDALHGDQQHQPVAARPGQGRRLAALPPPLDVRRRRHDARREPGVRPRRRAGGLVRRRRHGAAAPRGRQGPMDARTAL